MRADRSASGRWWGPWLVAAVAASGCEGGDALTIATPWDRPTVAAAEELIAGAGLGGGSPPRIRWVRLRPWDDPGVLVASTTPIDLLLGWPGPATFRDAGRDRSTPGADWVPVRRPGLEGGPPRNERHPLADAAFPAGDPRFDPAVSAFVLETLGDGDWRAGYARLIGRAADGRLDVERPVPEHGTLGPGPNRDRAEAILDLFRDGAGAGSGDPAVGSLELDLIGAVAFVAGEELRDAADAVAEAGDPPGLRASLVEPPPWPPSSVVALRGKADGEALVETLARLLTNDREARRWLVQSWRRPAVPLDRDALRSIVAAADGALVRDPRFLDWLGAEWEAWAMQHHGAVRRAARSGTAMPWSE